jgi:translation initiation factor 5
MKKSTFSTRTRNIGGSADEPFWRYKRPELTTKIEGRGGSTRTVITNMKKVARYLKIDPIYPTKFFSFELGGTTRYNEESGSSSIKGVHEVETLEDILDRFVELFVLCPVCKLPEIALSVGTRKNSDTLKLLYDCDACGAVDSLKVSHKLKQFILKHPPKTPVKKAKHHKGHEDESKFPSEDGKVAVVNDSDVVWFTDTSKEAQESRKKEVEGNKFFHLEE